VITEILVLNAISGAIAMLLNESDYVEFF